MPRFYVHRPDGKWNIFSSVADGYIAEGLTLDDIKQFRLEKFAAENEREVNSLASDRPLLNIMDFAEAEEQINISNIEE